MAFASRRTLARCGCCLKPTDARCGGPLLGMPLRNILTPAQISTIWRKFKSVECAGCSPNTTPLIESRLSMASGLAFYNELNPFAAETLRNLIAAGQIAPGIVDERSIEDLTPDELRPYTQVHLFAGIGVWSAALRRAGWRDEWPIWTASCPCQPFSSAGARGGFDDERHLWPAVAWLADSVRPGLILGEQVSTGIGAEWLDCVQDDLERMAYAFGALAFPAAMLGVAHARLRTYWMADAESRRGDDAPVAQSEKYREEWPRSTRGCSSTVDGRLADATSTRPFPGASPGVHSGEESARPRDEQFERRRGNGRLADAERAGLPISEQREFPGSEGPQERRATGEPGGDGLEYAHGSRPFAPGSTSRWTWARCVDGKARPFESGVLPVAHGLARNMGALDAGFRRLADVAGLDGSSLRRAQSYRVGAISAYGNALQLMQATEFCTWVRER